MTAQVKLVRPTVELRDQYLSFYEEWRNSGETIIPWVVSKEPYDFDGYVQFLLDGEDPDKVEAGWVTHSTYWLVNEAGVIAGAVNIRHALTRKLLETGGHIGYGVRPSERQKGYATAVLAMALQKLKERGENKALVTCDLGNTASEKTIVKNGGVLESEYTEEDGNVVRRFWIDIS